MGDPFKLGEHEGRLGALESGLLRVENTVDEVNSKLDTVLQTLAEQRGEKHATRTIAGAIATAVSIIIAVLAKWADR